MEDQEQKDIQALINIFFPFAEEFLLKFGEFLPFGGATTLTGEFVSVGNPNKNEPGETPAIIEQLKQSLVVRSSEYLVTAIFYEVSSRDSETGKVSDAIGVRVEHREGTEAYEFIYPYTITNNAFTPGDTYGNRVKKEIFVA